MNFVLLVEFKRDLKKLLKRFRSLNYDIEVLKTYLEEFPEGFKPIIFPISNLGIGHKIFKVKKFHCRSLKGKGANSGIRIIYSYLESERKIEFIEIYHKSNKKNHNKERILNSYN